MRLPLATLPLSITYLLAILVTVSVWRRLDSRWRKTFTETTDGHIVAIARACVLRAFGRVVRIRSFGGPHARDRLRSCDTRRRRNLSCIRFDRARPAGRQYPGRKFCAGTLLPGMAYCPGRPADDRTPPARGDWRIRGAGGDYCFGSRFAHHQQRTSGFAGDAAQRMAADSCDARNPRLHDVRAGGEREYRLPGV